MRRILNDVLENILQGSFEDRASQLVNNSRKDPDWGWSAVVIIQNGKVIGSESTNAQYGIAHATGTCLSVIDGGCLIATAAYDSELAPQVQLLREVRDNVLFSTNSGTSFMTGFNTFYYSFSPTVADWERQNPVFKEIVITVIISMLSTLSILNYVDIDSEQEMLGYGIGIILLNLGNTLCSSSCYNYQNKVKIQVNFFLYTESNPQVILNKRKADVFLQVKCSKKSY